MKYFALKVYGFFWVFYGLFFSWFRFAKYKHYIKDVMGFVPRSENPCIWIHAVSMGETLVAERLVPLIQRDMPHVSVILTGSTIAGLNRQKKIQNITSYMAPWDHPWVVKRWIQRTNPIALILIEREIWPSYILMCRKQGAHVVIANARLNERSFLKYQRFSFFLKPIFQSIQLAIAQDHQDVLRLKSLGIPCVIEEHNMKFDPLPIVPCRSIDQDIQKKTIWLIASTHEQEESMVMNLCRRVLTTCPATHIWWVPRHMHRSTAIGLLIQKNKSLLGDVSYGYWSEDQTCRKQMMIIDQMGVLGSIYPYAQVVLMGGSLIPHGGHNLLEPAFAGVPVVCGPHMFNFPITTHLIHCGHTYMGHNVDQCATQLIRWLTHENEAKKLGEAGKEFVSVFQGAAQRQWNSIQRMIEGYSLESSRKL